MVLAALNPARRIAGKKRSALFQSMPCSRLVDLPDRTIQQGSDVAGWHIRVKLMQQGKL
jgi:hypothetical protein